ncbi:NUDIX hydrolase, partial [Streptococcus canis]
WDIYTADRVETGRVMERGSSFKQGDYHLVVHICLFNDKGEMLIQQRQADKAGWPGLWDVTVGGSALAGETAQQAAMRELEEELGLSLELTGVRPHFTINFGEGFDDTFLV